MKKIKDGEYDEMPYTWEKVWKKNLLKIMILCSSWVVLLFVDDAKKALPYFEKAFELDNKDVEMLRLSK